MTASVAIVALAVQAANPSPPREYALEERLFWTAAGPPASVVRIHVSGRSVRTETHVDGRRLRTTIARPDRGKLYLLDDVRRTYEERSLAEGGERAPFQTLADYQAEARSGALTLDRLGEETIHGAACDRYAVTYSRSQASFHLWVSRSTGLPVLWTPEGEGEGLAADSRIEWTAPDVGPQPAGLFEVPADYTKSVPGR